MTLSQPAEPTTLSGYIARIAAVICSDSFSTGERAALRRMNPSRLPPLSFYRFAFNYLPPNWEADLADWLTIVAGIALMAPNAHRPDQGLGRVLAEEKYSETRLERLLAAEGDTLRSLLLSTARFLAAKRKLCNWTEAAQLLLTKVTNDHTKAKRETLHRTIARDYFQHLKEPETR